MCSLPVYPVRILIQSGSSMAFVAASLDATGRYASYETIAGFSVGHAEETDDGTDVDEATLLGGMY